MTATPPPVRDWRVADAIAYAADRATATDHATGWDMTFTAPAPCCGEPTTWTDHPTAGPRPGPCACELERNVA